MKGYRILFKDSRLPHLDTRTYVAKDGHVVTFASIPEAQKVRDDLLKQSYVQRAVIVDSETLNPIPDSEFSSDTPTTSVSVPATVTAPKPQSVKARAICPDCGRPMPAKKRSK